MSATLDTGGLQSMLPLAGLLGMRVSEATPEAVRLELDWGEQLCTVGGAMHGGALMSLADTADGGLVAKALQTQAVLGG